MCNEISICHTLFKLKDEDQVNIYGRYQHILSKLAYEIEDVIVTSFIQILLPKSIFANSLEASLVAHHLPLNEILQLLRVRDHVFVVVKLLVSTYDAKVYPGQIDLSRVLLFTMPDQREVSRQVVSRVLDRVLRARLVVQEAKFEGRLRLRLFHRGFLVAQIQYLHQVLDCFARASRLVVRFGVGLGEELVRLDLLCTIASVLAEVEEELPLLNSSVELTLRLVDHADLLVALGFDITVLGLLSHAETLFEELQRHVKFVALEIFVCNHLIDSHQVFGDLANDLKQLASFGFLHRCLQVLHGRELVEHLLFADTEATMGLGLALDVFELDRDVKAALVEIAGRFIVVEADVHLGHSLVSFEALARCLLAPVDLAVLQRFANFNEVLRCLVQRLLHVLVEILLFHQPVTRLDAAWGRLVGEIEEVDVGLHEAFGEQVDADICFVLPLFELEATVFIDRAHLARLRSLLRFLPRAAILLEHLRLGGGDQLILLLSLRLLGNLPDAGMRVENRLVFHGRSALITVNNVA